MQPVTWRIRISVLWLFYTVAMSAAMVLYLMEPGNIEDIMAAEMGGMQISTGLSLFFALFWLIPLIMAFLSLILKEAANRWANLVLGIVLGVFGLVDVVGHLSRGEVGGHTLMGLSMIIVPAVIAWHAWWLPGREE